MVNPDLMTGSIGNVFLRMNMKVYVVILRIIEIYGENFMRKSMRKKTENTINLLL